MKRIVSLSIFIVLVIIVLWSITSNYNTSDQLQQAKSRRYVEIFMNEFEMTSMDENGAPDYLLNGVHLQRYNDSDNTEIRQPVLQLLRKDRQWKVSAEKAIFNHSNDTLQLIDNVIMQQQNIEPAVTIRTQNLMINTTTKIAKTRAHVDITQGNSRIQSNGMIYNNITSELELSSSVNGHYVPYN